ncbi:hypothetical protein [Ilyobacter sp.]|uniref:hypothetical protein n=1 Tax=Ilyobacter sp. TaxID=3100343 RepID=UPI003564E940
MKKLMVIMALSISAVSFAHNTPDKSHMESQRKTVRSHHQRDSFATRQNREYKKLQIAHNREQEEFRAKIKRINSRIRREKHSMRVNMRKIERLERRRSYVKSDMKRNQMRYNREIKMNYHI